MSNLIRISKKLSWLLRHGAIDSGIDMDEAGWVDIDRVLSHCRIRRAQLDAVVDDNNKDRFTVRGHRIRAVQGHSTSGTPVTADGLEASWTRLPPIGTIFHGTHVNALDDIRRSGLKPMRRTHVHLARSRHSRVGKRANVSVLLHIDVAHLAELGVPVWVADNGVLLARTVPPAAITHYEGLSKRAKALLSP